MSKYGLLNHAEINEIYSRFWELLTLNELRVKEKDIKQNTTQES